VLVGKQDAVLPELGFFLPEDAEIRKRFGRVSDMYYSACMPASSALHPQLVYNLLQQRWAKALRADPIDFTALFILHVELQRCEDALTRRKRP
jgi:hypothetical protein